MMPETLQFLNRSNTHETPVFKSDDIFLMGYCLILSHALTLTLDFKNETSSAFTNLTIPLYQFVNDFCIHVLSYISLFPPKHPPSFSLSPTAYLLSSFFLLSLFFSSYHLWLQRESHCRKGIRLWSDDVSSSLCDPCSKSCELLLDLSLSFEDWDMLMDSDFNCSTKFIGGHSFG